MVQLLMEMAEGYRGRVSHEAIMEAVRLIMAQFVNTFPALEPVDSLRTYQVD